MCCNMQKRTWINRVKSVGAFDTEQRKLIRIKNEDQKKILIFCYLEGGINYDNFNREKLVEKESYF